MHRVMSIWVLAVLVLVLAGCQRYALDGQMEDLCKKDGGVKVYETVILPAGEFSSGGQPLAKYVTVARTDEEYLGPAYRYLRKIEVIVGKEADPERGEGVLTRNHIFIHRRSDGRLLGESIEYDRGGGDGFTFGFHPSGNYCPKPPPNLIASVFLKGE
jgi:hypothetical protein